MRRLALRFARQLPTPNLQPPRRPWGWQGIPWELGIGSWKLTAAVSLLVTASLVAQQPPTRFKSGVDLVTVDVVVLDKKGEPVPGLTRADFTILEDGSAQPITQFQSVELP